MAVASLEKILAKIQLVIFDVDGVLTDGKLYYSNQGETIKSFHSRDGLGIKMLLNHGIKVAIITGRQSSIVSYRAKELGINYVYQGRPNKVAAFQECLTATGISAEHTAVMGDDINDLAIMKLAGFGVAPANVTDELKEQVDLTTTHMGGMGAARELCDLILKAQDKWDAALKFYGNT